MNEMMLFVLLITPTLECIEKVTKSNLTNCRSAESRVVFWGQSSKNSSDEMTCDLVPEKDRKPVPVVDFKISATEFDILSDPCYTYRRGRLPLQEVKDYWSVMTSTQTMRYYVHASTFSLPTSSEKTTKRSTK